MGIPSYFSYIIKNHTNIIHKKGSLKRKFTSMYMDCNSIIYDCVRNIESDNKSMYLGLDIEDMIIKDVIAKIEKYIEDIQPSNVIYIAFDGVAPYAKMEQQRMRRHKTGYMSEVNRKTENYGAVWGNEGGFEEKCVRREVSEVTENVEPKEGSEGECMNIQNLNKKEGSEGECMNIQDLNKKEGSEGNHGFPSCSITPGTKFMNMLSLKVKRAFVDSGKYFGVNKIIVSGSDEPGEGEHKMFQYMREHVLKTETVAVYGLDADLIMLSVFHCFACENIYIFRESPEFGKSLFNHSFARDELLFLDNKALAFAILNEMGVSDVTKESIGRIYDYIFACFLLGNDFLPHFPALNIRTHGNFTVLETYRRVIARYPDRRFISLETGNIQWRWVKEYIQQFAKEEAKLVANEYESRSKMEKRVYPIKTQEERQVALDNIPTIYRGEEHYINPLEKGWEARYYRVAFHLETDEITPEFVNRLCDNYLEGLEWTFKYYTEGCPHWRWKYNYHYPPLFADLVKRIPSFETVFIDDKVGINRPFHPNTQLAYVMPVWNHSLVDGHCLDKKYYVEMKDMQFQWLFCKYFWEAHSILPNIPIEELEKLDMQNTKKRTDTKASRKPKTATTTATANTTNTSK